MKTHTLLAALFLLAILSQLGKVKEAPDQEQPVEEDQDVTISFAGAESSSLHDAGDRCWPT
jgi:hypothetical protein